LYDRQKKAKTRDTISEWIRAQLEGTHIHKGFDRENSLFVDQNAENEKGSDMCFTFILLIDEVYRLSAVLTAFGHHYCYR